jgi:hypothetical protein
MFSLKVAVIIEFSVIPVAPAAGTLSVTSGLVVSGVTPVVNVHTALLAAGNKAGLPAKALPAKSLALVVTVAVNNVVGGNVAGFAGMNVAVRAPTA